MAPRLYLRNGVNPHQAVERLRQQVQEAQNLAAGATDAIQLRDAYLRWVEATELQLHYLTLDSEVLTMLQTPRYWQIWSLEDKLTHPRPWPMVEAEIKMQTTALGQFVDDLERRIRRLSQAPGHITILDTNVLLHYQPPAQIGWTDVIGQPLVRLVLPLRVIEELDAKKYARGETLRQRARDLLPQLQAILGPGGEPRDLRVGVTIEVSVDPGWRHRPEDADEEVLDTCQELRQLTGQAVTLVTSDTAMRIRGEAHGLDVLTMPAEYARNRAG